MRTVVLLGGDGIGPAVVEAARRVIDATGVDLRWVEAEIGWSCWCRDARPVPRATLELLREHRVGLMGAITSRPTSEAREALPAHLQDTAPPYTSAVLTLRRELELDVARRPAVSLPGRGRPDVDAVVVMQNTEGLYAGLDWAEAPPDLEALLRSHPTGLTLGTGPLAVSARVVTAHGARRAAEDAARLTRERGESRLIVSDKVGVMPATAGVLLREARRAADAAGLELDVVEIDTLLARVVLRPEQIGVVLTGALIGDLLSDALAAHVGGVGVASVANMGRQVAVFEPLHGSAPRHVADVERMSPLGAIRAGAMLLRHLGETEAAARVEAAVRSSPEGRLRDVTEAIASAVSPPDPGDVEARRRYQGVGAAQP